MVQLGVVRAASRCARRSAGSLGGSSASQLRVLVEQLLELGQLVVGLGAHHRRHEVVDDHRVGAALGLHALAGVVDDEGVEERHVGQRGVGRALGAEPEALARQPLERAVLAEVDDRVGAEARAQPVVGGQVVVRRRQLGVVVDRPPGSSPKPRGGWMATKTLPSCRPASTRSPPSTYHSPGGGPHWLIIASRSGVGQRGEPRLVLGHGQAPGGGGELLVGEEVVVVAAGGDQRVDELVAVGEVVLDGVAGRRAGASSSAIGAGRRVEADGVADARVLGREAREHDHDARVGGVQRAQARVAGGQLRPGARSARGRARSAGPASPPATRRRAAP